MSDAEDFDSDAISNFNDGDGYRDSEMDNVLLEMGLIPRDEKKGELSPTTDSYTEISEDVVKRDVQKEELIVNDNKEEEDPKSEEMSADYFDDSGDELFSQLNDDSILNCVVEESSKRCENSSVLQLQQSHPPSAAASTRDLEFKTPRGIPSSLCISSKVGSPVPRQAAVDLPKPTVKSQEREKNSGGLSSAENYFSNKPTTNSREAFFANYESDEVTTFERNLKNLKRRFPGPAGLLPKLTSSEVECLNDADHPLSQQISKIIKADLIQKQPLADEILTPERGILRMNKAPWRELIKELELNPKDPKDLLNLMNIQWVKRKIFRHPATTKIPFLALVVQEDPDGYRSKKKVTERQKNPSIKFMDPTGTIFAAMDGKFVETYGVNLVPGTAIAVKNSGFLRFRRQIILTITQKNVICMTSVKQNESEMDSGKRPTKRRKSDESELIENVAEVSKSKENVGVIHFSDFNLTKILQDYESILTAKMDDGSGSENSDTNTNTSGNRAALYSTVRTTTTTPLQPPFRGPVAVTAVSKTVQVQKPDDFSVFCDDDDEDLMLALDNVDFLMEESSAVDLV